MGCTTSATPGHTPDANATGKHIKFTEELEETNDIEQITTSVQDVYQDKIVLPTCDTLAESIQLAENNNNNEKSLSDTSSIHITKVYHPAESKIMELDTVVDDKILTVEKVVEKVIEIKSVDSHEKITHYDVNNETDVISEKLHDNNSEASEKVKIINEIDHMDGSFEEDRPDGSKEEQLIEVTSPSQSESSRATRWEALADIAAELPPSLTVDPITGQIYWLAK